MGASFPSINMTLNLIPRISKKQNKPKPKPKKPNRNDQANSYSFPRYLKSFGVVCVQRDKVN
jgi:hypothetical protein